MDIPLRVTLRRSDYYYQHRSFAAHRRRIDSNDLNPVLSSSHHFVSGRLDLIDRHQHHHQLPKPTQPEETSMLKSATFAPNAITITVSTQKIGTTYIPTE